MTSEVTQFELHVMEPVINFYILQSINIMTNVLHVFREYCISGINANKKQLENDIYHSEGIINAIHPHVGYEIATEIA